MDEVGEAYRGMRLRVGQVVGDADDHALDTLAPATPEWAVRDLLAHLVGVTADIVNGNLEGVGTDPWAAAQVDARRGRSAADLLEEWDEHGPVVEALAADFGRAAGQLLADATAHEHDVRGALDAPGARDSDAVVVSARYLVLGWGEQLDRTQHGAIVLHRGDTTKTCGSGAPVASLRIDDFELMRALTGRRCVEQMAAYDWDGDFAPEQLVLARFAARPDPLLE